MEAETRLIGSWVIDAALSNYAIRYLLIYQIRNELLARYETALPPEVAPKFSGEYLRHL
jgi:hypothetical protein